MSTLTKALGVHAIAPDKISELEKRLDRLEGAITIKGGAGNCTDVEINASGTVKINAGGEIRVMSMGSVRVAGGSSVLDVTPVKIAVSSAANIQLDCSRFSLSAGDATISAGMTKCQGTFQADTVICNTVIANTYTPGAGNVW